MRRRWSLSLALALSSVLLALLACGPPGSASVYVGVVVPGPYVGYPYPYRGPYGGWVGRPYPSPYPRYDETPSSVLELVGFDPAPSDTAAAPER